MPPVHLTIYADVDRMMMMGFFASKDELTDQPDRQPTRKVTGSAAAGFAVVILLSVGHAVGLEVPGVDLEGLPVSEAFTGLVMFATAYLTKERKDS